MATVTHDQVIELLKQRLDILDKILKLTKMQPKFIAQEDMDDLLTSISVRQKMIDQLQEIQNTLPDVNILRTEPDFSTLNAKSDALVTDIAVQDKLNEQKAEERAEELKTQLKRNRDGQKAFKGYESFGTEVGATYFDKQK